MLGLREEYPLARGEYSTGVVIAHDRESDDVKVQDEVDGEVYRGSADQITVLTD